MSAQFAGQPAVEALPADPWEDFGKVRQSITAAMKKAVGMK